VPASAAEVIGEKRLAELEAALGSVGLDPAEYAALLAPVIDAPLPPSRILKLSPEEPKSKTRGQTRKRPSPQSMKRKQLRPRPASIGSTPDCIAFAAKSSSNKTPPTPTLPKPPSRRHRGRPTAKGPQLGAARGAVASHRLYQSTGRPIDAHEVLGPALAGFSRTLEFPQIEQAKALFEALAAAYCRKIMVEE
jgi:hypothetical protein